MGSPDPREQEGDRMTTMESPAVRALFDAIHKAAPHAAFGGSVPDVPKELPHSYHRSWQDIVHDDGYSVHYFGDKHMLAGKTQYSCGLDVGFSDPADMRKYTARLHHLAVTNRHLFWTHGLREFAGTLNSQEVFAWDTTSNTRTYGWDGSHLWHIHLSLNRRLVTDTKRLVRIAAVFAD